MDPFLLIASGTAFGLSIGDFVGLSQHAYQSIKTVRNAPSHNPMLLKELRNLAVSLEMVRNEVFTGEPIPTDFRSALTKQISSLMSSSTMLFEEVPSLFETIDRPLEAAQRLPVDQESLNAARDSLLSDLSLLNEIIKMVLNLLFTARRAQNTNALRAELEREGHQPETRNPSANEKFNSRLIDDKNDRNDKIDETSSKYPSWSELRNEAPSELESPLEAEVRGTIEEFRRGRHKGDDSTIVYNVRWQVKSFLDAFFGGSDATPLGSILTVTGSGVYAYATTCFEYLSQNYPHAGVSVFLVLQEYLQSRNRTKGGKSLNTAPQILSKQDASLYVSMQSETNIPDTQHPDSPTNEQEEDFKITVRGYFPLQVEAAMALSWICATFRRLPRETGNGISASTVSVNITGKRQGISISLIEPFEIVTAENPNSCWYRLLQNTAVVLDHPIPKRVKGIGLEISFNHMAWLARSLHLVEYDEGLFAEGLNTLLIPMKELEEDGALQWHLEYKHGESTTRGKTRKHRAYNILSNLARWHRDLDAEHLQNTRCFLGWTESVDVAIGTSDFAKDIRRSGLPDCISTGRPLTYTIKGAFTGGERGLGTIGIMSGLEIAPSTSPSRQLSESTKDVDDALQDSTLTQVIVYDNSTNIAWLVPQTYIILYLIQVVIKIRKYSVLDPEGKTVELPTAIENAKWDTIQALDIIYKCLSFKIKKRESTEEISKLVTRLCAKLDIIASKLLATYSEARKGSKGPPKYLFGYDLLDIARNESNPSIKELKVQRSWAQFAEIDGVVLFCKGFGQAIRPTLPGSLCPEWRSVPLNQNYLVATANSIQSFLERTEDNHGSRISDFVDWKVQLPLIQNHDPARQTSISCNHTQSLSYTKNPAKNKTLMQLVESCLEAGFIFDEASRVTDKFSRSRGSRNSTDMPIQARIGSFAANMLPLAALLSRPSTS